MMNLTDEQKEYAQKNREKLENLGFVFDKDGEVLSFDLVKRTLFEDPPTIKVMTTGHSSGIIQRSGRGVVVKYG